ncbi:unnamed protein product [Urochloa humidicola]
MVRVRIFRHADLRALKKRSDRLLGVELISLESVGIASDSCALLLDLIEGRDPDPPKEVKLIERRYWFCDQMNLLSRIAGVALELHKIKHDLYPLLVSQEASLEGGFLKDLLLLKNSAVTLERLAMDAKERVKHLQQKFAIDWLLVNIKEFGKAVKDTADLVLKGTHNIAWLQARLPSVLDPVDNLLSAPVHFPDPDKYLDDDDDDE